MLYVFVEEENAWDLLKKAVRRVWGLTELPAVERLPGGKPVFARRPELCFSLSHSGPLSLCALSDRTVGADIEQLRPRSPGLPAYVFRGEDHRRYQALGGDQDAFYTLWTEKESVVKYTGEGLRALRRAQVPAGCVLTRLSGPGWRGAVCGHGPAALWGQ